MSPNVYDMERASLSVYKNFEQLTSPVGGFMDLEGLFCSAETLGEAPSAHPSLQRIAADPDQLLLLVGRAIGETQGNAPFDFATLVARALPTAEACVNVTRRMAGCLLDRFYRDAKYSGSGSKHKILELLKQYPSPYSSPPPELSERRPSYRRKPPRPLPGAPAEIPSNKCARVLMR